MLGVRGLLWLLTVAAPHELAGSELGVAAIAHLASRHDGLFGWDVAVDAVDAGARRP